jgi:hypothetical protein
MDLICFIFACFGIFAKTNYSHHSLHTRFKIFAQIRIQIYDLMQKNTCCNEYLLQSEYSLKIFSYWRIFPARYSFRNKYSQNFKQISNSSEYSLANTYCFKFSRPNWVSPSPHPLGGGVGDPVPMKGQTLWYSMYTIDPLRWRPTQGGRPSTNLAWPGWKQPDIPVEVDTARLETCRFKNGFAKCEFYTTLVVNSRVFLMLTETV